MMLPLVPASPAPVRGTAAIRCAGRGPEASDFDALLAQAGRLGSGVAALLGGTVAAGLPTSLPAAAGATAGGDAPAGAGQAPLSADTTSTNPALSLVPGHGLALRAAGPSRSQPMPPIPDANPSAATPPAGTSPMAPPIAEPMAEIPAVPPPVPPPTAQTPTAMQSVPRSTAAAPTRPAVVPTHEPLSDPAQSLTPPSGGAHPARARDLGPPPATHDASPSARDLVSPPATPPIRPSATAPAPPVPAPLGPEPVPTAADPAAIGAPAPATAPPAPPEDAPLTTPAVPARIAELARRRAAATEHVVVRLDPPELGTVRISLTARGDQVHVTVRAETPEARAALDAQREQVENLLRGEGFDLGSFDVGHDQREREHAGPHRPTPRAPFSLDLPDSADAPVPAADGALRL